MDEQRNKRKIVGKLPVRQIISSYQSLFFAFLASSFLEASSVIHRWRTSLVNFPQKHLKAAPKKAPYTKSEPRTVYTGYTMYTMYSKCTDHAPA